MRYLLAILALLAAPAVAQETSALVADHGLAGTRAQLQAQAPSADRNLAIAATQFLGGVEAATGSARPTRCCPCRCWA